MPLTPPNLDDLSFEELVAEMRRSIPAHAPEWTNHNPSDPGITLIELFAFFGDALLYRLNRVSAANRRAFLNLLEGPDGSPPSDGDLDSATIEAVARLREPARAVTLQDVEHLVLSADATIARAVAVGNRDLQSGNPSPKPGHISVVVIPRENGPTPTPEAALLAHVEAYLDPRRLLGTRIHVVPPRYVPVSVRLVVAPTAGAQPDRVRTRVTEALADSLHPLRGGREGDGWPLGRDIAVSDFYRLVEHVPGVDHVERRVDPASDALEDEVVVPEAEAFRLERNDRGELVTVRLRTGELAEARIEEFDIEIAAVGGANGR